MWLWGSYRNAKNFATDEGITGTGGLGIRSSLAEKMEVKISRNSKDVYIEVKSMIDRGKPKLMCAVGKRAFWWGHYEVKTQSSCIELIPQYYRRKIVSAFVCRLLHTYVINDVIGYVCQILVQVLHYLNLPTIYVILATSMSLHNGRVLSILDF